MTTPLNSGISLAIIAFFVLVVDCCAQESSVGFGTYAEKKIPVPLQITVVGPTHHVIDVLKSEPLSNGLIKLKTDTAYFLKLRFGSRPVFRYHKITGFSVPQTDQDNVVQVQLEPNKLTVKVTRTVSDTAATRIGNQVTFSGSRRTVTDYEKAYDLSTSSGDEYGFLRDWTSADGKVIKATYLVADSTTVTLKGINGRIYQTSVASLSEADRTYLKQIAANPTTP